MLLETGEVVRMDVDGAWVRTVRQSVCGACHARAGCGQNLLNQLVGTSADIKVNFRPGDAIDVREGDRVEIGIAEGAVVAASLLAYGAPLVGLILAVLLAPMLSLSGGGLLPLCLAGISLGIFVSRGFLKSQFRAGSFEPILIRKIS